MEKKHKQISRKIALKKSVLFKFSISAITIFSILSYFWLDQLGIFSLSKKDLIRLTQYQAQDNTLIFDRHDKRIGELFSTYYVYKNLKDIPNELIEAIVAIEDRNFWKHYGVDPIAIGRAVVNVIKTKSYSQGGSTITQQLVRNILLSREKTFHRKIKEVALSLLVEQQLSKGKILEIYLNALFLGNGSYGVGAAAIRYFGKPIEDLQTHELALIAGLFQSPSAYNPHRHPRKARQRQKKVLVAMAKAGYLTVSEAKYWIKKKLKYKPYNPINQEVAPYFIDYIREEASKILGHNSKNLGLRIYTTLDSEIQKKAQHTIQKNREIFDHAESNLLTQSSNQESPIQAALLVTNPHNGHILAMVGGRDYKQSQFNRTVDAYRSPGSSIKPVTYSLALEEGYSWADLFYVDPIAIDQYRPKNYSKNSFLTETTLLRSFYKSINTIAIELGQKIGLEKILDHAKRMGIETILKEEFGTLIGGSEVTMKDMAKLYGTIANHGVLVTPIAITRITDRQGKEIYLAPSKELRSEPVLSKEVSYLMLEGLQHVFNLGTASSFRQHKSYAAGKTGTSNQSKDNWFCGFTPEIVAILWAGVEKHIGFNHKVTASNFALPLWSNFINQLLPLENKIFHKPDHIEQTKINPIYGNQDPNGITASFLKGKSPNKSKENLINLSRSGHFRNIFSR